MKIESAADKKGSSSLTEDLTVDDPSNDMGIP